MALQRECPKCRGRAKIQTRYKRKLSQDTQTVMKCPECGHQWRERAASGFGRRCRLTSRRGT